MLAHAHGDGPLKGLITVMGRLIELVDERRGHASLPHGVQTMTGGAFSLKNSFPCGGLRR